MKIGELAKATGTPVETIRFYEKEGLLPPAARTPGNYRIYGDGHAQRLAFIRHCRSLDMALDEVRVLLRFKDAPADSCAGVNHLLDAHIGHVAQRIRELQGLEQQLQRLRQQCAGAQASSACPILQDLSDAARPDAVVRSPAGHVAGTRHR